MEFQGSFPLHAGACNAKPKAGKPQNSIRLVATMQNFASGRYRKSTEPRKYLKNGIDEEAQTHCFPSFSENQIIDFICPLK